MTASTQGRTPCPASTRSRGLRRHTPPKTPGLRWGTDPPTGLDPDPDPDPDKEISMSTVDNRADRPSTAEQFAAWMNENMPAPAADLGTDQFHTGGADALMDAIRNDTRNNERTSK